MLRKRAFGLLKKLILCKSANQIGNGHTNKKKEMVEKNGFGTLPRTIRGDPLIRMPNSDSHFNELAKAWK